jgi:hypothetical protein
MRINAVAILASNVQEQATVGLVTVRYRVSKTAFQTTIKNNVLFLRQTEELLDRKVAAPV